jgi:hypothetical protein
MTNARLDWPALPARARIEVELSPRVRTALPPWTGSLLHGALGHAVMLESPPAEKKRRYAELFEAPRSRNEHEALVWARPAPLRLIPPAVTESRWIGPGEHWTFGVQVFGAACNHASWITRAIERMAAKGLGRNRTPHHVTRIEVLEEGPSFAVGDGRASLSLELKTPLRLYRRKQLLVAPCFADLVVDAYRRVVGLATTYGEAAESFADAEKIASATQSVATRSAAFRRVAFDRYSARQDRRHAMEGILGNGHYEGEAVATWGPLVALASEVGMGKSTSFGFGAFEVSLS